MKSRIVSHRLKKVTKKRGKSARVERTMRTQKRASEAAYALYAVDLRAGVTAGEKRVEGVECGDAC